MGRLLTLLSTRAETDTTAPSGYSVSWTTNPVSDANANAAAFQFSSAEVGTTFNYTITSSGGGGAVSGSGTISSASQSVTGINVSGLADGTLTVSATLTDAAGNTGIAATATVTKAWLPTDISGLALWLDASDTSSITQSGGSVSQWNDKSGNARHATQGTGANQPTTGTRAINGLNTLDFDGSNDTMALASGVGGPLTILFVAEYDVTTTQNVLGSSSSAIIAGAYTSGIFRQRFARTGAVLSEGSTTLSTATPYIYTGYGSAAGRGLYLNGVVDASSALDASLGSNTITGISVSSLFNGKLGEVVIYNGILSAANLNRAGNALAAKWGRTWTNVV